MPLHPVHKRHLEQIVTFGVIWLFFGLTYAMLEYGLLGNTATYPATGNSYNVVNSLIMVSTSSLLIGLVQGTMEVLWFKKLFSNKSFWTKIIFKSIFYLVFVVSSLVITTLIYNAYLQQTSVFAPSVLESLWAFMRSFAFWSIILYTGIVLDIALFYSEIRDYLGNDVLINYLGKYHKPRQETRIFMFLDMKSSTTIAESLGHEKYFRLLKSYYADMTNAILETTGEIYQYVGDEIVVTWKEKSGINNNNCLQCFVKINKAIQKKRDLYLQRFGIVPEFKAGYHIGKVTTGEIGIIKKDLIHTGDILNTAARIQSECNPLNAKILISGTLRKLLNTDTPFSFEKVDTLTLRGKKRPIQLFRASYE